MPTPNGQPTLLVFTRGAEREARRRRLLPAHLAPLEVAVHHRCLDATLAAGRDAGCAVVVSSPTPLAPDTRRDPNDPPRRIDQRGGSFGERLRAAIRATRRDSEGPMLVVGTDTPGLGGRHLRSAIELLADDPDSVVLGPARDGGIYLLATRRPLDEVLSDVAWRHRGTADSLLAALAAAGIRVRLLEPLADLDRPQDLALWASGGGGGGDWRPLVARVRQALAALRGLTVPLVLGRPRRAALRLPGGRAPPLAA